jgi:adenylate cyclase
MRTGSTTDSLFVDLSHSESLSICVHFAYSKIDTLFCYIATAIPLMIFKPLSIQAIRFPLSWQIMAAMAFLVILTTGTLWLYLSVNLNSLLKNQSDTFAQTIIQQAANSSAEMVMADDQLALATMLDNLVSSTSNIQHIAIYNDNNDLLAEALTNSPSKKIEITHYQTPIIFQDVQAGLLTLTLDNSDITESLIKTRNTVGLITSIIGLITLLLSVFMSSSLTAPLHRLQKVAVKVSKGELNPSLPPYKNDEVGDLVLSFKKMLQGLRDKESIENKFSSYISKDIAKDILSNINSPTKPLRPTNGSVLFIDIVGFTQLCEKETPNHVADILNNYYFLLHQAAKMYRGTVDNYIGDGAMLTFGIHKDDNKHCINAICTAEIFIRLTDLMNSQRHEQNMSPLEFRLGLHCGDLLAGTIGSSERMQSTISGDTVNLASRMCEQSTPGSLLISESVYKNPVTKGLIITGDKMPMIIKGKTGYINCYQVTGLAPKFNRLLMQQEAEMEAMQSYV